MAQLRALIRSGEATRRQIVQAHLARIAEIDPIVNAFIELRGDAALAEADAADARQGRVLAGPLDGIPFSIKDSYGVAGLSRTDGLAINADRRSVIDDSVVARLRAAGALILGHGNVPDLCVRWNTISGVHGTTRNPRDPVRTVGGSSGGEAASVAAGMAVAAIGQDLGGSIRVPASFCGVYGIRTTPGVVPNLGEYPAFPHTPGVQAMGTIGPLARTVADLETVSAVIRGHEPADVVSVPITDDVPSFRKRVAVLRGETGAVLEPEIERRLDETVELLREAGYEVVDGVMPDLRRASELWAELTGTDLVRVMLPRLGDLMIESGRQHVQQMFGQFELGTAAGVDLGAYNDAWIERTALYETWARFAEEYPLVVAPVAGMPTPLLDFDSMLDADATMRLFDQMRCVPWVNLFGLPALALPNGIQLVGRRFREAEVFAAARAVEPGLGPVRIATPDASS